MKDIGLKCNIKKSLFGLPEIEYLGFWAICDDVKLNGKK